MSKTAYFNIIIETNFPTPPLPRPVPSLAHEGGVGGTAPARIGKQCERLFTG